ncbi:MAG: Asp-tRNA(Asn)/Glu-tRNA(Gln) amidotransferase subunit GatC [Planctomycetes bacterium]|nr:Asp-tRNA(Asn)/Glu-tRNA(Gln) amidotransferase subunit GatC [Planctomycetota bacterium]
MGLSKREVLHVAHLGRIHLADDEVEKFADQLSTIVDYVNQLSELDTEGVEPLAHALPIHNVLRPDEPRPGLSTDQALGGAPDAADGFFRVPRVIDDGSSA